jgi:16S rRNA (guanine1516-N2)-methyltransferase
MTEKLDDRYSIKVYVKQPEKLEEAKRLVEHLSESNFKAELIEYTHTTLFEGVYLCYDEAGLCFGKGEENKGQHQTIRGDFTRLLPRLKHNNLSGEMLVKATKIKGLDRPLNVIDATAGMGEDSLLLAAAGCNVTLYEKDPVIAALLRDTIERALDIPELKTIVTSLQLIEGDSIEALNNYALSLDKEAEDNATQSNSHQSSKSGEKEKKEIDVILLDPMFPQRQKSALVKKKFQLIHNLEKPCDNEEELLNAAFKAMPRKIVIKRPLKGAYLAGRKPDYSLSGKAIRYDCFQTCLSKKR